MRVDELANEQGLISEILVSNGINPEEVVIGDDKSRFDELPKETKVNILRSVLASEEKFSEDELRAVSILRESNMGLEDFVNNQINKSVIDFNSQNLLKLDDLSDRDIYSLHMRKSNPNVSEDEITERYGIMAESGIIDSKIKTIREVLKENETLELQKAKKEARASLEKAIDKQRNLMVDSIKTLDSVGGWSVDKDTTNEVLTDLMETVEDENGNVMSVFENEVLSDPQEMFRLNWYRKYGDIYFDRLKRLKDKENRESYQKGYEDALNKINSGGNRENIIKKDINKENISKISHANDLID